MKKCKFSCIATLKWNQTVTSCFFFLIGPSKAKIAKDFQVQMSLLHCHQPIIRILQAFSSLIFWESDIYMQRKNKPNKIMYDTEL